MYHGTVRTGDRSYIGIPKMLVRVVPRDLAYHRHDTAPHKRRVLLFRVSRPIPLELVRNTDGSLVPVFGTLLVLSALQCRFEPSTGIARISRTTVNIDYSETIYLVE